MVDAIMDNLNSLHNILWIFALIAHDVNTDERQFKYDRNRTNYSNTSNGISEIVLWK